MAKCQDFASPSHDKLTAKPTELGLVSLVRYLGQFPLIGELMSAQLGACLVLLGVAWMTLATLRSHPYLVLICAGFTCVLAGMMSSREGVISYLPEGLQEWLLRKTMFDFLAEDTAMQNFIRRWGRMMMLCQYPDASSVDVMLDGLEPNFVHHVLSDSLVSWLPNGLQRVLLPEALAAPKSKCHCCSAVSSAPPPVGGLDLPLKPMSAESAAQRTIDPVGIADLLQEKKKDRDANITERSLPIADLLQSHIKTQVRSTAIVVAQGSVLLASAALALRWAGPLVARSGVGDCVSDGLERIRLAAQMYVGLVASFVSLGVLRTCGGDKNSVDIGRYGKLTDAWAPLLGACGAGGAVVMASFATGWRGAAVARSRWLPDTKPAPRNQ